MTPKRSHFVKTSNGFVGASVQQKYQISKKSLAMNVNHLMVDSKPVLLKKTVTCL